MRNLNLRPFGSVGDGKGSPQPIVGRTLAHRTPRSTFCSRHSSAFFRAWLESLGCEGEAGFIYAHMTSQNLHEMLTQLYLELGLSLQDALRAAEADFKHNSPPSYSTSEISFSFGSERPFHEQYLLQSRNALVRALTLTPPAYA
jgi:hypothetical protein